MMLMERRYRFLVLVLELLAWCGADMGAGGVTGVTGVTGVVRGVVHSAKVVAEVGGLSYQM
jgi:hypothetical protein